MPPLFLQKKRLNDSSTKDAENHEAVLKEVKELEAEMDVRSAQIADITQRLMDTDQGEHMARFIIQI